MTEIDKKERLATLRAAMVAPENPVSMRVFSGELESVRGQEFFLEGVFVPPDVLKSNGLRKGCRTVHCIAGMAEVLAAEAGVDSHSCLEVEIMRDYLGIEQYQAWALTYPPGLSRRYVEITREMILRVLDILAETGHVDWAAAGWDPKEDE